MHSVRELATPTGKCRQTDACMHLKQLLWSVGDSHCCIMYNNNNPANWAGLQGNLGVFELEALISECT